MAKGIPAGNALMEVVDDFGDWYRAEHPALLAAVALLTGDLDSARDITAEAFSIALERWADVAAMANPVGWTYVVAVNLARRRWRRRLRERLAFGRLAEPTVPFGPDSRLDVYRAVRALPDRARLAVVLRYFGGLSEAEVAEAMGVAVGTASATLTTARRRLSVLLTEEVPLD
ncbi:MAG: sigma factor-like helix-turn-helix DNA-binding protein [Acidimicrobiales bacterium]